MAGLVRVQQVQAVREVVAQGQQEQVLVVLVLLTQAAVVEEESTQLVAQAVQA